MNSEEFQCYTGTSYRHIMVWKQGKVQDMAQPHDHLEQVITPYLPEDARFAEMMKRKNIALCGGGRKGRMFSGAGAGGPWTRHQAKSTLWQGSSTSALQSGAFWASASVKAEASCASMGKVA